MSKKTVIICCAVAAAFLIPVILFLLYFGLWSLVMQGGTEYRGDYPAAYTVAIYSFLGSRGSGGNGEITMTSDVGVLETDEYGRVLFYYHEGIFDEGCGYGIMQFEQDGYAYFYEDDCVIAATDDWDGTGEITHDDWFAHEEVDAFKKLNDWNLPLNEEKCAKEKIVTRKSKSKLKLSDQDFEKAIMSYCTATGKVYFPDIIYGDEQYFISDDYGREMYYYRCPNDMGCFAFVFNPDGTFAGANCAVFYEDVMDFCDALKELKRNSGWNREYLGT